MVGLIVPMLFVSGMSLFFTSALLIAPLLGISLLLGLQCLASARANKYAATPPASSAQMVKTWLIETRVAIEVFFWHQPFFSNNFPDSAIPCAGARDVRGVLFVHGFVCNRGIWNHWYPALIVRNIPFLAVNLEPVFGSIDSYAQLIDEAVNRLHRATGKAPLVVCHSMGGLAVRAWLKGAATDTRVHRVVTIGSPHQGTRLGGWVPEHAIIARNAQQMRLGSRWLQSLAQQEDLARRRQFVCFYSNCDNIVFPATSGALPGADNRYVSGIPHLAMAFDASIREEVLKLL